ncbi:PEP/pyruvate-binding domain-containing protein [Endozoicomonas sp. 2B-B]
MFPAHSGRSEGQIPKTDPNRDAGADSSSKGISSLSKRHSSDPYPCGVATSETPLTKRHCRPSVADQTAGYSPQNREQLGGKGMFLWRMKKAGLSVPPFECVTAQVMNTLEQHPLDSHLLDRYFPGIVHEWDTGNSLRNIRDYLNTLPPSEQTKRDDWLSGLAEFIASNDYYQQVKDSEAARQIAGLRRQLGVLLASQAVIVRSSGINEDNYGDAQAGKYLSLVQGEEDILRTCLKVMASAYRPEICPEGIPQPMALIIQQCIDCRYGGVAMSFQSFQDDTVRIEYTRGQPRGAVAGQSGNRPHRIDIYREDREEEAASSQYFPGTISSRFILQKNDNGYSETRIDNADAQSGDVGQQLSDDTVSTLMEWLTELENLLLCPVDVEFAIDHQGCLFLLQVRPVTRLSGGMDFVMSIPEETLAIGEGVSEGFCTGPLWLASQPEAGSMPEGAIVVAHHAEDWMLGPEFLKRVGGFVIAEGGFNDHVAIFMKQAEIALMLAGGQFTAVVAQVGQQATLACARFNEKPGAFIVAGDLSGKLASCRSLSSAFSDLSLAKAVPSRDDLSPPEGTFLQVADGFQWLTDQNARLLAMFASCGGLDCLANPVKLSMSRQRSGILAKIRDSVNRLVHGAEAMLEGYRAFLLLAGNSSSSEVQLLQDEVPLLSNRFKTLKQTIQSLLEAIILPQDDDEERQLSFRDWLSACQQLQSCLQALNPREAEQFRSVHEVIFALHLRFIKALAPITLDSGQGRLSREKRITYVDYTTQGNPDENASLLSPTGKAIMNELELSGTVVIMDDALLVNLGLGVHVSLVELFENAEGGKGRTLRLKFSDQFDRPGGLYKSGKLQRVWFLTQFLKAIELDENADPMRLSYNAVAREVIVECTQMQSPQAMQYAFEKLMVVLDSMTDLDILFDYEDIFEEPHWDFNLLAQRLNPVAATEADRFTFQHCLFSMFYKNDYWMSPACCQLLSNDLKQFVHHTERLGECRSLVYSGKKPEASLKEIFMSDDMNESMRRELLHHFLLLDPYYSVGPVEDFYHHLRGQYFIIKPSHTYTLTFVVPPFQSLSDIKEKVRQALLKDGLEYASQRVRNDKDLVLEAIAVHPFNLKYVGAELKSDKDVIVAAVTQKSYCMSCVSPELPNYDEVVIAAIAKRPAVVRYASEKIRSDKNIIQSVITHNIDYLAYASNTVLNNYHSMLDFIEQNPRAFEFAAPGLKLNKAFIEAAKQRNPAVIQYTRELLDKV